MRQETESGLKGANTPIIAISHRMCGGRGSLGSLTKHIQPTLTTQRQGKCDHMLATLILIQGLSILKL